MLKPSFILLLYTALLFTSCATSHYGASIDKPMGEYSVIRHVTLEDKGGWVLLGASIVNKVEFEQKLRDVLQSEGGDEIINVTVTSSYDIDDIAITLLSLFGLAYSTRSFTVEADIIKYK